MKTQKEQQITEVTYQTANVLCELFAKYKDYDSTLEDNYGGNSVFKNNQKN